MIEEFLKNQQPNASGLAVVVTTTKVIDGGLSKGEHLLFHPFGDRTKWRGEFGGIAASKAALSVRTGRNSADLAPHYRMTGDTIHSGSVVLDDIVVACSGIKPYYDEMISMWLAATIKALAKARFDEVRGQIKDFIE